jgi:hypothetical protein
MKLVGFGRATRPCALRAHLFRLIKSQNRALRASPHAHCSFAVLLLITDNYEKFLTPLGIEFTVSA